MNQTGNNLTNGMTINEAVISLGAQLKTRAYGIPLRFSFDWAGRPFQGCLTPLENNAAEVEVIARLGALPFTAENSALRRKGMDILSRLEKVNGIRFRMTSSGEVQCTASTIVENDLSAVPVAQSLTVTLLHLRKYMNCFDGFLVPVHRNLSKYKTSVSTG